MTVWFTNQSLPWKCLTHLWYNDFHEFVLASFSQNTFPGVPVYEVLYRLYPYTSFLAREGKQSVEDLLATFHLEAVTKQGSASIENVIPSPHDQSAQVSVNCNGQLTHFQVRCFVHCIVYLVTSSLWKWVLGISPGVKAAGAFGWWPTTLVVPKVEKIRGLNLPGTPRATSACRRTPLPVLYFYLVTSNSIDIKFCVNIYSSWNTRVYFVRLGGPLVFVF